MLITNTSLKLLVLFAVAQVQHGDAGGGADGPPLQRLQETLGRPGQAGKGLKFQARAQGFKEGGGGGGLLAQFHLASYWTTD